MVKRPPVWDEEEPPEQPTYLLDWEDGNPIYRFLNGTLAPAPPFAATSTSFSMSVLPPGWGQGLMIVLLLSAAFVCYLVYVFLFSSRRSRAARCKTAGAAAVAEARRPPILVTGRLGPVTELLFQGASLASAVASTAVTSTARTPLSAARGVMVLPGGLRLEGVTIAHVLAALDRPQDLATVPAALRAVEVEGGYAPLHIAAMFGHTACAEVLLAGGAGALAGLPRGAAGARTPSGASPFHLAARYGREETLSVLLAAEPAGAGMAGPGGWAPLHYAAGAGRLGSAERLLAAGACSAPRAQSGATPLHLAAQNGHLSLCSLLLSSGSPASSPLKDGSTPLLFAAAQGHAAVCSALIAAGADVDAEATADGARALDLAAGRGHCDAVSALLAAGAEITASSFEAAVTSEDAPRLLSLLLRVYAGPATPRRPDGRTVMHAAARLDRADLVALLARSLPGLVSAPDSRGRTPLHEASLAGSQAAAAALIRAGADPAARDTRGVLPAALARGFDFKATLQQARSSPWKEAIRRLGSLLSRPPTKASTKSKDTTAAPKKSTPAPPNPAPPPPPTPPREERPASPAQEPPVPPAPPASSSSDDDPAFSSTARATPMVVSLHLNRLGSKELGDPRPRVPVSVLDEGLQDAFICPISFDVMRDPVQASDGHSYEREELERWIETARVKGQPLTSPMTREPISEVFIPNIALRKSIAAFLQRASSTLLEN